jgi:hypothetical protein
LIGQQSQRPTTKAGGRPAQPQRDQFCLGCAVEQLRRWTGVPFLANQCLLETVEDEGLPYVLDGSRPATDRLADLGVIPSRPVGIALEQNCCPPQLLRLARFLFDRRFANRSFLVREPHDILLVHRNLLVEAEVLENRPV